MDKGEFAYRKNLENARAALARRQELDSATDQFKNSTAAETLAATKQGLMRPKARPEQPVSGGMAEGMGMALMESFAKRDKAKRADAERSTTGAMTEVTPTRPEPRYETEFQGEFGVPGSLGDNAEFTQRIKALADRRGISESELYKVIQGESGGNSRAQNKSGATGLFQFMPDTAKELGTTTKDILSMSPSQQVDLYDKYLDRWNYSGSNRLGIMQAAPAYANSSPETVVYKKDSAAWRQNPGWRELNGGSITVRSINSYYAKQT